MRRKTVGLRKWFPRYIYLVAGLLLATAVLLWVSGGPLRECLLTSYYEGQLATADSAETEELLSRLMTLGRRGTAAVVRALAAPLPATRQVAYRTLVDELNRYERQAAQTEVGSRLSNLACALADSLEQMPDAERPKVEVLAMKIVALAEEVPLADRGGVIESCQRVLPRHEVKPQPRRSVSRVPHSPPRPQIATRTQPAARNEKPSERLNLARFSPPVLARADVQTPVAPGLLRSNDAVSLKSRPEQRRPAEDREQVQAAAFTPDSGDSHAGDQAKAAGDELHRLDVIELFNQLRASPTQAAAVRAELESRGFSPRQIDVGEHLVSPDAAERLQWTEWLPGIRGVDARFWLLRLSHDVNGQVRRAAVGLLATDRDPEVVRRLQRVVIEDSDERIRVQASRALEMLGGP